MLHSVIRPAHLGALVGLTLLCGTFVAPQAARATCIGPEWCPFVEDSFDRTVTNGFGTADTGGLWSVVGTKSNFSVSNGFGSIVLPAAGASREAYVGPAVTSGWAGATVAPAHLPTGGPLFVSLTMRRIAVGTAYAGRVTCAPDGRVTLALTRTVGGTLSVLASTAVSGLPCGPGSPLQIGVHATGTAPTYLSASVESADGSQPGHAELSLRDPAPELQFPGAVGVAAKLGSPATGATTVLLDRIYANPDTFFPNADYASDQFGRYVTAGWGNANMGGAWTIVGAATRTSVLPYAGSMRLDPATTVEAYLPAAVRGSASGAVGVSVDRIPVGSPAQVSFSTRRTTGDNRYAANLVLRPDRTVVLRIVKVVSGVESTLASKTVAGLTYSPGSVINVRFGADGTAPTALHARAWAASAAEPTTWQVAAGNSDPALQTAGAVAVIATVPSAVTNGPVTVHFQDLLATCDNCVYTS